MLSFDARDEDGNPRRFAGMWRPPNPDDPEFLATCPVGPIYIYAGQRRAAWLAGDYFDRPLWKPRSRERMVLDQPTVTPEKPEKPRTHMGDFEKALEQHFCHLFSGQAVDDANAQCVDTALCGGQSLAPLYPGHPMTNYAGDERCACGNPICPECRSRSYGRKCGCVPLPEVPDV